MPKYKESIIVDPVLQIAIPKGRTGIKNYVLKKIINHCDRKRPKFGIPNIRLLNVNAKYTNPRF